MNLQQLTDLKELIDHFPDMMKTLAQKFREEWTYHTNAIEGNTMTLQETSFFLREGLTAKGKTLREHFEVVNHGEAVYYLQDTIRHRELSEGLIKDFHAMLFEGVKSWSPGLTITPGAYKTLDNHVLTPSGEIHYYTPAIQLAAEFHHRFVAIHPFQDGNGRVGGLCMNFILMQAGYPPAIIRQEMRLDYYLALEQAELGNSVNFSELIVGEVQRSLETMKAVLVNK